MSGRVESFMLLLTLFLMLKSLLVAAVNPMPMRRCSCTLLAVVGGFPHVSSENIPSRYIGYLLFWVLLSISIGISLGWSLLAEYFCVSDYDHN